LLQFPWACTSRLIYCPQHISGPGLDDRADFETGYLSDPDEFDLKVQLWTYKKQREIVQRMKLLRSEIPTQHPQLPKGSRAASPVTEADIEYSLEDDQIIEKFLRTKVGTTWHAIGTCKMAAESELGVVDQGLGVHGVRNFKIADLSIAPGNVSGNTMSTALLIGERAADLFIRELGLGSA
jgi:alcohol oxidase